MGRVARLFVLLAAPLLATAAAGQEGGPPPPPGSIAFSPIVARIVGQVIVPGYQALSTSAEQAATATAALCTAPDPPHLAAAREGFAGLVAAWSRVEMFRFGPARDANRYERLFFWPDRRGLGQRQVDDILASKDEGATEQATLRDKSVAVQGLLALEYVLYGDGSTELADGTPASFRCRYGGAVAGAIAQTAREIVDGWTADNGFAAIMRDAGPDNPVYRSHGEVIQDVIRSAREQLQVDADLKLSRAIGKAPPAANPRRSPFWRSDQTLPSIIANVDAVVALQDAGGLAGAFPKGSDWYPGSLAFELKRVATALAAVQASGVTWEAAVRDPASHQRLAYALIPLGSAIDMLGGGYPQALGLITGFNSRDGD